jgi:hypothetical protein
MRATAAIFAVISCATAQTPGPTVVGNGQTCHFGPARAGQPLGDRDLIELSGLVASRAHPGVLYAHNDSGDTARFFAMDLAAQPLGRFELEGATARDWEDISLGPCPEGTCVFLGDIGDNRRVRSDYAVYRVKEPALPEGKGTVKVPWERFAYEYPDAEKNNAETLLVHPVSGEVYVITKQAAGEPSRVFKFPMPMDSKKSAVLIKVVDLKLPEPKDQALTAGDLSPDGTALLLRMYNRLVELKLPEKAPFEKIFTSPAVSVPVSVEAQGEAVAWRADGRGYYTSSEEASGVKPTLNSVECAR